MPTYRIAHRFHFKLGNKIVLTGITNDPFRRERELRQQPGWEKGHVYQVGLRITVADAFEWVREQAAKGKPVEEKWFQAA